MKKILFIITKSENGGAQKWTKEQIEISSKFFDCYLATDKNGWLVQNINIKKSFLNTLLYERFSLNYLMKLSKFVKINNIDLIIASSANAGIYARLLKFLNKNIKVIYVSHGWSSIYNGGKLAFLYTFIEKQLSIISDSILCISKKDYENAKDIIGIRENKLKQITNKIYPIVIKKNKNKNKIRILTVARLTPPKRIDLLIRSVKDLEVELHIIGDGILRNSLELIKNDNVFFHGEIDNFDNFCNYSIFALISDSEGLPLSVLEAMSVGLPVILSNVGGCFELIDENGVLVNNTVKDIQNAIYKCSKNINKYSENSKNIFNKDFNLANNKEVYINYYKSILGKRV